MGMKMKKFSLLMWKNWILQVRHPVQTLFEILVPVFFCAVLVLVRSLVESTEEKEIKYPAFNPYNINILPMNNFTEIAYSPNSPIIKRIMSSVEPLLLKREFNNSKSLEAYLISSNFDSDKIGVAFPDNFKDITEFPHKIDFTLRFPAESKLKIEKWRTNLLFPLVLLAGPREREEIYTASPAYFQKGFLSLQHNVSSAIINEIVSDKLNLEQNLKISRYPYPAYMDDPLLSVIQQMIGLIIVLAFVYSSISIIKVITAEKEKQLKESMKIMGLPSWLHWTAWFVKSLTFMLISIIIMVALLKIDFWYEEGTLAVFPKTDAILLFLFLLLYICSIITLCFGISVFFTKANMAAGIGGVTFFLFLVPYTLLQNRYQDLSLAEKLLASLMSNSAMGYGFQLICMFESTGEGLQWSNMWRTVTPDDNLVMGHVFIMLLVDTILYILIALYVEAVYPGKYGVPKKWHFIFTWWSTKTKVQGIGNHIEHDPQTYETEPTGLKAGVEIRHLGKTYANKVAVKDLSLNMFEDQITVLLGHNGAGKTTTMSMLTGIFPPTTGTAKINGYDICRDINKVRTSLGLCPQHNILFDELTVSEHIYFYSSLKGMEKAEIKAEIETYLKLLQFEDKRNKKSCTLSGGMKRKLSVAVAFCGNSKVVMLDEPTAGMDPAARRALWELVNSQKKGRTIMLTTHFMDEADLLGDRIAIMAGGVLQCCGSSFFLKKKYGAGYHLIMEKSISCNVNAVTELLQTHIPHIKVQSNIGTELTYLLNEEDSSVFEDMLKDIEKRSEGMGIKSYGISLTTLEEVFMKVGADTLLKVDTNSMDNLDNANHDQSKSEFENSSQVKLGVDGNITYEGYKLYMNHIKAMFMKRFLITLRSWTFILVQMLIPILLLTFAIISGRNSAVNDLPELKFTLDAYDKPVTVLASNDNDNEYYKTAKKILEDSNKEINDLGNKDMINEMLKITTEQESKVRLNYIIGASFVKDQIIGWFNNNPYHSPPLALNYLMNIVLKKHSPDYEINVFNHPLPYTLKSTLQLLQQGNNIGFQLAVNIGFCMAFISAFYILFYVRERICKVKHLQIVSGVNIIIFWMVSFLWDILTYAVTIVCLIVTLICFQENGFKSGEDIGRLIFIFIYFGFAMLPLTYMMSFIFKQPSSGFIRVILFTTVCGTFAFMIVEILSFDAFNLTHVAKALDWIFLFVPHYSLSASIRNVNMEYVRYTNCQKYLEACVLINKCDAKECEGNKENYYSWEKPGILRNIIISFGSGIVLIATLFLKEYKIFSNIIYAFQNKDKRNIEPTDGHDSDVQVENENIRNMSMEQITNNTIVLKNVTKYYKNFMAVNGICLGVNQYECFGLLGVNGAGKTSTFRMITGDARISYGDVYVNGLNLKTKAKDVNKVIGYCPQFDALFDDLTAKETIEIFCLLRGFSTKDCSYYAEKLARDFDFAQHLNKQVKQMSGGNKRKLSTAVALIGNPPILYLDEPTTGMDPATKRYLWNVLCKVRDNGKCLILTSHSMEECEALCTRLAIMVNGTFKCLGSTQHLKNKFSKGYTLTIKLHKLNAGPAETTEIETFVQDNFPNSVLREKHQELITFYLPDTSLSWSTMFGIMERAKASLNIEDYSLGQSSLEEVFLTFTKTQTK